VSEQRLVNRFYFNMGLLLLALVLLGFCSAAFMRGTSPSDMPFIYHLHGLTFITWFVLFILQAYLIGSHNPSLHKKLGYSSLVVVGLMMVTAFMMSAHSYARGISPIPDISIQQFLAFPLIDLAGLLLFFSLGIINRHNALFHKHCMLVTCIAIMDPAIARLAVFIGIPPLALLIHLGLVGLVMLHDRRVNSKIHLITWMGLGWVIFRVVFIFTVGSTDFWANMMDKLFG
jgi:hypothetical protein